MLTKSYAMPILSCPSNRLAYHISQMVLDAGRLVEFDSPAELLKNEKSFFRSLVDESGAKEKLYELAAAKASQSGSS
jgi:ABC-type proline/glycine betaine transport system ATPase subunit